MVNWCEYTNYKLKKVKSTTRLKSSTARQLTNTDLDNLVQ